MIIIWSNTVSHPGMEPGERQTKLYKPQSPNLNYASPCGTINMVRPVVDGAIAPLRQAGKS